MKLAYAGVMGGDNGFTKAMRSVCDEFVDVPMSNVNSGLQSLQSADIVFLQPQDAGISAESLLHLKQLNSFVVNWSGDVRSIIPPCYFEYAKYVDLTAFSNMNDVKTMRSLGYDAYFLQIGADPDIYYPDNSIEKDIDITFLANNYGHFPLSGMRKELVVELKRTYGEGFKAYGIGQPDGNFMSNQKGEADIYRRSKIGINLSHYNYERYTSDRMFRMLCSGVLVLTHEYPGIYEDFNPHDFGVWRNLDELKSQINYYLANEEARVKIAANGHQKALDSHTFSHMAKDIINLYLNR